MSGKVTRDLRDLDRIVVVKDAGKCSSAILAVSSWRPGLFLAVILCLGNVVIWRGEVCHK